MQKFAALISYRGSRFCGWQRQSGSAASGDPSIQETLEQALESITQEKASVVGSGRTDSGVNALGQVAHFRLEKKEWDPQILFRAMNSRLPMDIRILEVKKVPMEFHAQVSAIKKQYSYYFQQGSTSLPHLEPYSFWVYRQLNVSAMNEAAQILKGSHDFKPFQAAGAKPLKSTVREIFEAEVSFEPLPFPGPGGGLINPEFGFVRVKLVGSGFLRQMVRGIAGTLLEIGENKRSPQCIREILDTKNRDLVGATAPGRALWLEKVWYRDVELSGYGIYLKN